MHNTVLHRLGTLALLLSLGGCTCGFDCSSDNDDDGRATFSLYFSDALPEDLDEVVIEVDRIVLKGSRVDDVDVPTFTIADGTINVANSATVPINLLDYPGARRVPVISNLDLAAGEYSSIEITVVNGTQDNVNTSYVQQRDGERVPLSVAGSVLQLGGIRVPGGSSGFTVEFDLARALVARSADYRLGTEGIRIVSDADSARLRGTVDSTLLDSVAPCDAKTDPERGNRLYLYRGADVVTENLADVFRSDGGAPENAEQPYAVAAVLPPSGIDNALRYEFGFLPPGDYRLAFACDTGDDDPVDWDDLQIPLPTSQVYDISLSAGDTVDCNLGEDASC
ncbi:MAG: DUF4382 domain-containing protein [Halioglobus sp.]|nr:DUF4382 domain-containing protein [Halioglobus sp.]